MRINTDLKHARIDQKMTQAFHQTIGVHELIKSSFQQKSEK